MNSRAPGWSVTDVVAHMGSGCHAMFSPAVFTLMRADSLERNNDRLVDDRRDRTPAQVLAEYRRWSRVFGQATAAMTAPPLAGVQVRLAELGRFPMRLLPSALVFDHYTHLRHDIAPALGRGAPAGDANRMAAVLEWMMAVLSSQIGAATPAWFDRTVAITLTGPGGGSWAVTGAGTVVGDSQPGASRITAAAAEFPNWGTRRSRWRDHDVRIEGDVDYGAAFLDWVRVI